MLRLRSSAAQETTLEAWTSHAVVGEYKHKPRGRSVNKSTAHAANRPGAEADAHLCHYSIVMENIYLEFLLNILCKCLSACIFALNSLETSL